MYQTFGIGGLQQVMCAGRYMAFKKTAELTQYFFILMIATLTVLTACKNYYNETIKWADNIKIGTDIKTVKNNQPDFVKIDWVKSDTIDNRVRYIITKIKGNRDILGMSKYLVFTDNKYIGREAHK